MNGTEMNGRNLIIEFSRPGGNCYKNKHRLFNLSPDFGPPPPPPPPETRQLPLRHRRTSPRQEVLSAPSRRRRSPSREESVEKAMSGLRLEERGSGGKGRKNSDGDCCSSSGGGKERKGGKPWKGKQKKLFDPKFMIKEEAIVMEGNGGNCKDTRTTVMIKNIPNKYSQKLLLNMLDNHCIHCNEQIAEDQPLSSYDFLYLPIDFNNKCNVGYGFVNMTSPEATLRLYKAFHHQHWEVFNSRKICEVTYARVQGLEALKEHFKNSKFGCENEEYLPVVFSPPRDGRQLTAPIPIVLTTQLPPSAPSPTVHHHHNQLHDDDHNDKSSPGYCSKGGGDMMVMVMVMNDDDDDEDDGCSDSSGSMGRSG